MKSLYLSSILILFSSISIFTYAFFQVNPSTEKITDLSTILFDKDGKILEIRLTEAGYWRELAQLDEIDPSFIEMLIAYEDKRFFDHFGVDLYALGRVILEVFRYRKVVSGASTLTMQLSRLLDPRLSQKTIWSKFQQMIAAVKLEKKFSKRQILQMYLTLAPYGSNLEGIHAASQAWLQKLPIRLTPSESALLVALPQSPENRRPDRHLEQALQAKNRVLEEVGPRLGWDRKLVQERLQERLPLSRWSAPGLAPHLMDRLQSISPQQNTFITSIDSLWQKTVRDRLYTNLNFFPVPINGAVLIAERKTGILRAYVGSRDYNEEKRSGSVNFLTSLRSPGSTLKPWIYVSALDRGILNPNSILDDSEFQSGGYNPSNFDEQYIGKLTLKDALLTSRNIPAIEVLEKLNPQSVEADIRSVIGENTTQRPEAGLSLAVGGFYLSPEELAKLYLVIGNEGRPINLKFLDGENRSATQESKFSSSTTNSLLVLLSKINSLGDLEIVKTGTAAHRQDAWAIMLTKDHLLVVWLGTPQNQPTNSLTGAAAALPIAREIRAALDLKEYRATEKLERERNTLASRFENVNQAACKKLIVYPEDQAWLRSEDLEIAVRGKSNSIEWFVNGETTKLNKDSVRLEEEGFHKITASTSECEETVSIFVEVKGRP